ncbi:diversity-generating retroelement protein Avd [Methanolobus psychrotolerans]|uniref:diversity-generating retroelement protein Avd n=1 Tax=Methanolobus psychrotolerans TaxID=1874706 RepID=UPI000B916665|nr:diversity-generating retroelement protein Avd [Methanolobus psychrotolerans]
MDDELQLFVKWTDFLKWLLNTTEKFPKKVRFTFTTRIDNLALDILEDIIEFRYDTYARKTGFKMINIKFEKLRILLRICHEQHYLSNKQFEYAMIHINEVGRMTGAWLRGSAQA